MTIVAVVPKPTVDPARVEVLWDADIQGLYCRIAYPEKTRVQDKSTALRDMLDAQWPLPQPRRMIVARGPGGISMALDAEERLRDFDIRTDLTERVLPPIASADADYMEPYIQASFDEGGDAECPAIEEAIYDSAQGIVCLSWGAADLWCIVAPTLALGLAADGALMKIQLSEFSIPAPKPRQESAWERLKRKFS